MEQGPAFPPELFDLIVDDLDDVDTLRACSLVFSSLYDHARARVFSHLRINHKYTIAKLDALLAASPSLAMQVKSLHLHDRLDMSWMEHADSGQFWSRLVSLTRLSITSNRFRWDTVSHALRNSIRLTLSQPTLTCLELTRVQYLSLKFLSHCPALRFLRLKCVTFKGEDFNCAVAACTGSAPTRLQHLDLDLDGYSLEYLVRWILFPESPLDVPSLHSLVCPVDIPRNYRSIQYLLGASTASLQYLRLEHAHHSLDGAALDLRALRQLHTLTLDRREYIDDAPRRRCVASNLLFPSPPQQLAVIVNVRTTWPPPARVQLAGTDRVLGVHACIGSVTVNLFPVYLKKVPPAKELVDVSGTFVWETPLLMKRLGTRSALRVLQSPRFPDP
ncbi:hypothetical protein K438DRAFT_1777449 [Mycena galopus ATCC 62051]|nr:hypothetical protein K438DRAFT_1777449 [Mycena galopus ATCC 62051]